MKGFVPTPCPTVDTMVELLFRPGPPRANQSLLDPGCGTGEFIDGVIRWCRSRGCALPRITGVESDPRHLPILRTKYAGIDAVRIEQVDFLAKGGGEYDFIIGNPPYVPITGLSETEKADYRSRFSTARGRFDLYLLFFEQALRQKAADGRLVFITPEKYLYVETAGALRDLLSRCHVEEIRLVSEDTFGELVTYPTITVVSSGAPGTTRVVRRDGTGVTIELPSGREPWLPLFEGGVPLRGKTTLGDLCLRLSCGVATGADGVFVCPTAELDDALRPFARATIAGRELNRGTSEVCPRSVMLIPYGPDGRLTPLDQLGALGSYLLRDDVRSRLIARTCARRKPWHAFHETPVLRDILRPKILCKDIGESPHFWVDRTGEIVPRHSVYYIVPKQPEAIDLIAEYLRSPVAHEWLRHNCQRAAKGFLRLQSRVLQRLPVPDELAHAAMDNRCLAGKRARLFHQANLTFG
jgi:adenine-specific DNA-methyltransferase